MTRINLPRERQVGHLTLHRQDRTISVKEYNALTCAERLEMIRQVRGKQKYDLLINATDVAELIPQLHPQELYLTVNDLGAEYFVELLALASTEQITCLLDLDCWDEDMVSPVLSLLWLQLVLETGPDKVCQLAQEIEPELLALFLKKHLTITAGLEAYDDDDAENAKRMQGIYDIDYASDEAAKIIGQFLLILIERDQQTYLFLMELVRSEMVSTLEEEVFQQRNNRLSDLGFVPAIEAREIYAFKDPKKFTGGGKDDFQVEAKTLYNPGALLVEAKPDNLLAEVLSNGLSHELASELCLLANRKMSADKTDLASATDIGISLQQIYDTLNLALEHLAGSDIVEAEHVINSTYLLHLFQLGHSLITQEQKTALQILNGPIGHLLDYPEQLFLDALLENPPALYRQATDDKPSDLQPIATSKNLSLVNRRLQQIEQLQQLFSDRLPFALPGEEEELDEELSLSLLFLTAIANQVLKRPFAPLPLAAEDLLLLKAQTMTDHQLNPEFADQVRAFVKQLGVECSFFVEFCLEWWQEDFDAIDPTSIDSDIQLCLLVR